MTTITIRRCSTEDAPVLAALGARTFHNTFDEYNDAADMERYVQRSFSVGRLTEELMDPRSFFFVAENSGQAVGYAKIRTVELPAALYGTRPAEIERLYVDKQLIGAGLGNRLMETCLAFARENNFDVVWLGVWEHNERAKRFYQRWGFEAFGQHVFLLGDDVQTDLLMKKPIG